MIQITDRQDFTDKFAALMAADISLIHAGIDPKSPLIPEMIDTFLEQFNKPEPATDHTRAGDTPFGFVIRDRWDGREIEVFRDTLYPSEEAALATIDQAYDRPDYNEFLIIPLYV